MKWYHKIGIGISSFLFSLPLLCSTKINEGVLPSMEDSLLKSMRFQEKGLGIKHFGVPNLEEMPSCSIYDMSCGSYDPKLDRIYFHTNFREPINRKPNLLDALAVIVRVAGEDPDRTLKHELGHFYVDKLSESLGMGNWPNHPNEEKTNDKIGVVLVSEGIASYFERRMAHDIDYFKDSDWPKELNDFWTIDVTYNGGYHLVKQIVDRYRKKGIEYLIANPPAIEDLANLPDYQNNALKYLSALK